MEVFNDVCKDDIKFALIMQEILFYTASCKRLF